MCKNENTKITAAILAGGKSSRMGKDKAQLTYNGKTFLNRLITEFSSFDEIIVSVASTLHPLPHIKFIQDENHDKGPLEGLRQVLKESKNEFVFVCATDMPFVTKALPEYLAEFFCSDYEIYVPTVNGKPEPLCSVYKKSILPVIENQIKNDDLKLSHIFEAVPTKFIPIEKSSLTQKIFLNINTPQEYADLQKPFIFCVSGLKNSGKTRMICALLTEAKARGYSCAVIKHDGHDCFTDAPETDTFYFSQKGAAATAIFSDSRFMLSAIKQTNAEELIEKIKSIHEQKLDFIILEGLKDSDYPKIEVMRKEVSEKSVCKKETLICTASNFEVLSTGDNQNNIPNYDSDDTKAIFDCIEKRFKI